MYQAALIPESIPRTAPRHAPAQGGPQPLRPYQHESLNALRRGIAAGVQAQVLQLCTGAGKCHGIDTPILMADGTIKAVQDVRVGDRLLGPDGKARNVLALGRGREEMFRIVPIKGEPYTCNRSHILSLKKSGTIPLYLADGRKIEADEDVVAVPLDVLMRSNATAKHCLKGWRAPALEFGDAERADLPVPPYILGAWLGDGRTGLPAICKPHCGMTREWSEWCKTKVRFVRVDEEGTCPTHHATNGHVGGKPNPALDALREAGVIDNKHIPASYKTAPISDRLELLAGLIDSDGHLTRNGYDWISKSEILANDFAFVARSLGLACYVSRCTKTIRSTGFSGEYWRCSVSGDTDRIPCRDKVARERRQKKRHLVHGIRIEPLGIGDYYGFEIDGDRLYLLGDFTVTHNTTIASHVMAGAVAKGKRAYFVVDSLELVDQAAARFISDGLDVGVIQGNHELTNYSHPVQVATIQTLRSRWPRIAPFLKPDVVVIDECHVIHAAHEEIIAECKRAGVPVIGLSATPFRKGLGNIFDGLVVGATTAELTAQGFLVPAVCYAPFIPDLQGIKTKAGGDWQEDALAEYMGDAAIVGDVVDNWRKLGEDRQTIVFAANVAHSRLLMDRFRQSGVRAEHIDGYDPDKDARKAKVDAFRDGEIRVLCNVGVLTKGFDAPETGCVVLARPTKSLMLHIQMLGRGLRTAPGKQDCIVIDHAGNCLRNGLPTDELPAELDDGKSTRNLDRKEREKSEPVTKPCVSCGYLSSKHQCPACGFKPERRQDVEVRDGELYEITASAKKEISPADLAQLYAELLGYAQERGYSSGWAYHACRDYAGRAPKATRQIQARIASDKTRKIAKHLMIKNAKRRGK